MSDEVAFLNGQFIPAAQAQVSVQDSGFMLGITVAEQLRTFNGQLFCLSKHLQRLQTSMNIVGVEPALRTRPRNKKSVNL